MLTRRLTLSKITATFNKVIDDLSALKEQNVKEIASHQVKIDVATQAQLELQEEHDAAERIHKNVTALLT